MSLTTRTLLRQFGPPVPVAPSPTLASVMPNHGTDGGGVALTLVGTGFQVGMRVVFVSLVTSLIFYGTVVVRTSAVLASCHSPAMAAGVYQVSVVNPDGQGSNALAFTAVRGAMKGSASIVFGQSGKMTARYAMKGSASIVFGQTGNLTTAGPPPGIDPATLDALMFYDGTTYDPLTGTWPGMPSAGNSGDPRRTATQAVVLQRPTFGGLLNGKQVLLFSRAASQFLNVPGPDPGPPPLPYAIPQAQLTENWTLFSVHNWISAGAPNNGIDGAYDNEAILGDFGTNRINYAMRPAALQILVDPLGTGARVGVETLAVTPGTWQIGCAQGSGALLQVRTAGNPFVPMVPAGSGRITVVPGANIRIGCSSNPGGTFWGGRLASFIMIRGLLDLATCDGVIQWLENRWGV